MRTRFFRFWVTAGAMWAAVFSFGSKLQAQAEPEGEGRAIALVFDSDESGSDADAEENEKPQYWLGITLKPIEGDLAQYLDSTDGVLVDSVFPESPASAAGVKKGDIIVAVGEAKLTDPSSLLAQMLAVKADEDGKIPALKLTVLRKGESKSIELTPVARPTEKLADIVGDAGGLAELSIDLDGKSAEEIEEMVEKLHNSNSDVRILRFGVPAKVPSDSNSTSKVEIRQTVDGKKLEVKITREGDAPAKVTVNRDGETKEYSSDKMEEMPEDIRKMVVDMMEKGRANVQSSKAGEKPSKDRLELRNRITLLAPELKHVMDKEMADKIRSMAKEIEERANVTSKWVKSASEMPEEIKELKSQVESLRSEIKELREQLKATKQSSDK